MEFTNISVSWDTTRQVNVTSPGEISPGASGFFWVCPKTVVRRYDEYLGPVFEQTTGVLCIHLALSVGSRLEHLRCRWVNHVNHPAACHNCHSWQVPFPGHGSVTKAHTVEIHQSRQQVRRWDGYPHCLDGRNDWEVCSCLCRLCSRFEKTSNTFCSQAAWEYRGSLVMLQLCLHMEMTWWDMMSSGSNRLESLSSFSTTKFEPSKRSLFGQDWSRMQFFWAFRWPSTVVWGEKPIA